ncbi:NAD-dependent epimerase/dehydratase family protein [Rhizobium sp. C1]|uniref:NAD-dependent epimerase/dehydratase family protein n=1 Tax=Rhizobium sp. C1 TaxID=1349799 RepID=UPI001E4214F8|nr:NAD(P)-dependent oxidoreductase [Rhizobium sp. C1]MCD2177754.1 NAD(P)-dependent oxidoreductase [Rhizobium sp. C1]
MKKRILFTGGSGKAGRHVIPWLIAKGYEVHNIDLVPLDVPGVTNLTVDITDLGEVFNALTMHRDFPDLESGKGVQPFDAVVHFAAVPRILIRPDNETYRVNVMGTYNVIEASVKLGIRKVIIASSETTYGICFAEGHRDPHYLPFDEDYDVNPMDSYGLSKVINEKTARAFSERTGADVYALRIGNVIEPHEYSRFPGFVAHPETRLRNAWCYIDARDLGQIVHLCIEKDGLGYQVFNATNDTVTTDLSTAELAQRFFPNVPLKWQPQGDEAMISNRKIREVLGFREEHNWRKYV